MKPRTLIYGLGLADINGTKLGGNFYHVLRLVKEMMKLPDLDIYLMVDPEIVDKFAEVIPRSRLLVKHRCYGPGLVGKELFSLVCSHLNDYDIFYRASGQLPFMPFQGIGITGVADINFHDLHWRGIKRWYKELGYHYSFLRSEAVVTISGFTRGRVATAFGVSRSRCRVVHHGSETHFSGSLKSPLRHLAPGQFWFCFGHRSNKNLEFSIDCFDDYKKSGGAGRLVVLGDNAYSQTSLTKARYRDSIDVIGYVHDAELAWLYSNAAGLIFPSVYEGFGLPLLEAMRYGCPVIASDIEVHREVAGKHAVSLVSLTCSPVWSECMQLLEKSQMKRDKQVGAGYERIKYFTWASAARTTADYLLALYDNYSGVVV